MQRVATTTDVVIEVNTIIRQPRVNECVVLFLSIPLGWQFLSEVGAGVSHYLSEEINKNVLRAEADIRPTNAIRKKQSK